MRQGTAIHIRGGIKGMRLFEPGRIGKLFIKNRIVMAPMGPVGLVDENEGLSQRGIDYYSARARGGVGLITTGMVYAVREIEAPYPMAVANSPRSVSWLSRLADATHRYGTKVSIQLSAGRGRILVPNPALPNGGAVSASSVPNFWNPRFQTRELTETEIRRIVKGFEYSASLIRSAGIDAIEIHGHQGYLIDQFATSLWNKRHDRYGGDLEGRMRFGLELVEAVKRGAGPDFPVVYRFGLTHYLEGGRDVEEGLEIARRLERAGVDALHVDAGCYETDNRAQPPGTQRPGCNVSLAEMAKNVVSIPIIAVGKLGYPALAESVLQEGKADFIALGRPLLADPDWPNKVREGKEEIIPCLGCHEGCLTRGRSQFIGCAVNPLTGGETELLIRTADRKKSVLVVGGGPAGMEAAMVAALRGHNVSLWERGSTLGGNLIPASTPVFKEDYRRLANYLSTQVEMLGVNIELGKEATSKAIEEAKPDVLFIATGGMPILPEIRGVEKRSVVTAADILLGNKAAGKSAVVIGGGMVGCETALHLVQNGSEVTIIEVADGVMRDLFWINAMDLRQLLAYAKVNIMTNTTVSEIGEHGVVITDKDNQKSTLETDTVVIAVGMNPDRKLLESKIHGIPEIYAIGDCVKPRKVIDAIWEAYRTARLV